MTANNLAVKEGERPSSGGCTGFCFPPIRLWFVVLDDGGRYTYEKQPSICKWNCMKLGEALHPMISTETTKPVLEELFDSEFEKCYLEKMKKKVNIALVLCIDVRIKIVIQGSLPLLSLKAHRHYGLVTLLDMDSDTDSIRTPNLMATLYCIKTVPVT